MRNIAEQSGIEAASIYYHFASKEELVDEVMEQGGNRIISQQQERLAALGADGLLDKVRTDGEAFGQMLAQALGSHRRVGEHVGDIRGRGFFWGVELVANRASKAPFDAGLKLNARIKTEAMQRG